MLSLDLASRPLDPIQNAQFCLFLLAVYTGWTSSAVYFGCHRTAVNLPSRQICGLGVRAAERGIRGPEKTLLPPPPRDTKQSKIEATKHVHTKAQRLSVAEWTGIGLKGAKFVQSIKNWYSVALVRERTIPTERPPPVGEVSANFCG